MLEKLSKKIMNMRMPDLKYIIMNNFELLKVNSFFQSQELLQGKSICDICLNDMETVQNGLMSY